MKLPPCGEVWLVDLGLAAKVRPCLVFSVPILDTDRSVIALEPNTTSVRGTRFETPTTVRYLMPGAFDAQGMVTVPLAERAGPASAKAKALRRNWQDLTPRP